MRLQGGTGEEAAGIGGQQELSPLSDQPVTRIPNGRIHVADVTGFEFGSPRVREEANTKVAANKANAFARTSNGPVTGSPLRDLMDRRSALFKRESPV